MTSAPDSPHQPPAELDRIKDVALALARLLGEAAALDADVSPYDSEETSPNAPDQ